MITSSVKGTLIADIDNIMITHSFIGTTSKSKGCNSSIPLPDAKAKQMDNLTVL